jgi:hypothetical protein
MAKAKNKPITVTWSDGRTVEVVFCVITDAPEDEGNLYDTFLTTDGKNIYVDILDEKFRLLPVGSREIDIRVKATAFQTGELLTVTRDYGREVNGPMRKPHKWYVGFETYAKFEDALERSVIVTDCHCSKKPIPPPTVKPIEVQTREGRKEEVKELVANFWKMPEAEFNKLPIVKAFKKAIKGVEGDDNEG